MANLIPPHARTRVLYEYWLRVATVWLTLVAAVCVVLMVLIVPTYILITAQQAGLTTRIDDARSQQEAFDAANRELKKANELASYIDHNKRTVTFTSYASAVDTLAENNVTVRNITFSQDQKEAGPITVAGDARDRTTLAEFRKRLEASELFTTVDLPISNLAGDRNIPFTLSITVADN